MQPEITRHETAAARPIPPFGAIVKWLSDALQLDDLASYPPEASDATARKQLVNATVTLGGHTAYNLSLGEIVREDTKELVCAALATALRSLPQLPFQPVPQETFAAHLRYHWTEYDQLCEMLSSFPDHAEAVRRCIVRHITLEFAIRAAAIAELCDDPQSQEDAPPWSKHSQLKKHLKKLAALCYESQEQAAKDLGTSRNELSRWLNELDIPPNGAIREWDKLLTQSPKHAIAFGQYHLWRLYVGRRIYNSLQAQVPKDLAAELYRIYSRVKQRIRWYLLRYKPPTEVRGRLLDYLLATARIKDPLLAADLLNSATDPIWRRHIETFCQVDGFPSITLPILCEIYANSSFGRQEASKILRRPPPVTFDEGLRRTLVETDKGEGPIADSLRTYEIGARMQANGDLPQLAGLLEAQTSGSEKLPAHWASLGRVRQLQGRLAEAEACFRKAVALLPTFLDLRTDLAFFLANTGRPAEALQTLDECTTEQKQNAQWKFVCGRALLLAGRAAEAKEMLLVCAKEPYKFGAAFLWLAQACETLGDKQGAKEYRKRAAELGVADNTRPPQPPD
jgi:tetratricopeptide (TPR) repeat protein